MSALVSDLICNYELFFGQLYADKSLVLSACYLIFFTTDHQLVIYYSTEHCYNS